MKKNLIISFLFLTLAIGTTSIAANNTTVKAPAKTTATTQQAVVYINAEPADVVKTPQKYLNKNVNMI